MSRQSSNPDQVEKAIGKDITIVDLEIKKVVTDNVKKRAQDCFQTGVHHLKKIVVKIQWDKFR